MNAEIQHLKQSGPEAARKFKIVTKTEEICQAKHIFFIFERN